MGLCILLHNGCASVDYKMYKPEATEEDFSRDESECLRGLGLKGESGVNPSQLLVFINPRYQDEMRTCLQEKGWRINP